MGYLLVASLALFASPLLNAQAAEELPDDGSSSSNSTLRLDDASRLYPLSPAAWAEGASALESNPAGLGFRTPFSAGMGIGQRLDGPWGRELGVGAYGGAYGLALAGRFTVADQHPAGAIAIGFGHSPARGMALGGAFRLHDPGPGARAYGSWDVGLALRPTSWLALGGAARDLARIDGSEARFTPWVTAGLGLRPFGRRLTLGFDWQFETPVADDPHHFGVYAQVEPVDGVQVWATVDEQAGVGLGMTLAFRTSWIGGQAHVADPSSPEVADWSTGVGISVDHQPSRLVLSRSVAEFRLAGVMENPTPNPLAPHRGPTSFEELLSALRRTADEHSVVAVLLRLDGFRGGLARTEELRAEIARLQAAGKPVYAYLESGGGNVAYYLASACDRVWLHPGATLTLTGLSTRMTFYRGALDKLGVEAQFSRIGEYKSSPEQYTEYRPTEPNLRVRNELLDDRFDRWLAAIAAGRGLPDDEMRTLIDDGPYPARLAQDLALVDGLVYGDEVARLAAETSGRPGAGRRRPLDEQQAPRHWRPPYTVAVVHIDGLINTGPSGRLPFGLLEVAGSETITRAIRAAREDRSVAAIVLRIDSPGGSAFASEQIWREVSRTRGVKPVVVSMGAVAASGGYFSACAADHIVADPSTVTGSIGVYSGKVSLGGLYDKLGVTIFQLRRGDNAGLYDMATPWSPSEYGAVERIVDALYADFIEHVREGRGMDSVEDVDAIARGRVWTGSQALDVGLVDELGGLMRAVEVARERAGIPEGADVALAHSPRVGLLSSLQIGKGFVRDLALVVPEDLRWSLSTLVLVEMQADAVPALMLEPVGEVVE